MNYTDKNLLMMILFVFFTIGLLEFIILGYIDTSYGVLFIFFGAIITTAWNNYSFNNKEKKAEITSTNKVLRSVQNTLLYNNALSIGNIKNINNNENVDLYKLSSSFISVVNSSLDHNDLDEDFIVSLMGIGLKTENINNQIDRRDNYILEIVKNGLSLDKIDDKNVRIYNKRLLDDFKSINKLIDGCKMDFFLNKKS